MNWRSYMPRPDYFGRLYELELNIPNSDEYFLYSVEVTGYQKSFPATWNEPAQAEEFEFTLVGPDESTRIVSVEHDPYNEYDTLVKQVVSSEYRDYDY